MIVPDCATGSLGYVDPPVVVTDVDLGRPPDFPPPEPPRRVEVVLALVRLHTYPLGTVTLHLGSDGMGGGDVAVAIERRLGPHIRAHLKRDGLAQPDGFGRYEVESGGEPRCLVQRAETLAVAPLVTVIVATRDRTDSLRRCLDSLLALEYPRYEILVVDNAPSTSATSDMIAAVYADKGVRYLCESRRGLTCAHNRGIQAATGKIVAFTDDDVVVDRHWLAAIAEGFAMTGGVGAVTGLIQPGELRTIAQLQLERHGAYAKGFETKVFHLRDASPADRRFPLATGQCGSGANMAFDAGCLRRLGGFDPALGAGTSAKGGDDLAAFLRVIAAGYRLVYQPGAVVRHWHRDDMAALAQQAYGYGVGLGAYLSDAVVRQPGLVLRTALRAPGALIASAPLSLSRSGPRYAGWTSDLTRLERRGVLVGPLAYVASRWQARGAQGLV